MLAPGVLLELLLGLTLRARSSSAKCWPAMIACLPLTASWCGIRGAFCDILSVGDPCPQSIWRGTLFLLHCLCCMVCCRGAGSLRFSLVCASALCTFSCSRAAVCFQQTSFCAFYERLRSSFSFSLRPFVSFFCFCHICVGFRAGTCSTDFWPPMACRFLGRHLSGSVGYWAGTWLADFWPPVACQFSGGHLS